MASKVRNGKGYELTVLGLLTLAGFDVYGPLVDDQGIDGVIRIGNKENARYYDIQIKGSQHWNGCRFASKSLSANGVLVVYCDRDKQILWFTKEDCMKLFPSLNPVWGDLFLKMDQVRTFQAEGRGDLRKLLARLEEGSVAAATVA